MQRVVCEACGIEFLTAANRLRSGRGKFCCKQCAYDFRKRPLAERFGEMVRTGNPADCWEWLGRRTRQGYGVLWVNGRNVPAHRLAYEMCVGPIGDGLFVCHHCDNPPCVNPSHLYAGTAQQNTTDCISRGRRADNSGEKSGQNKLTEADVVEIRRRYALGERAASIARDFQTTYKNIHMIVRGRTWKRSMLDVEGGYAA